MTSMWELANNLALWKMRYALAWASSVHLQTSQELRQRTTPQTKSSFFPQSPQLLDISVVNLKLQKYHIWLLSFSHPVKKFGVYMNVTDNTLWWMNMYKLEVVILKISVETQIMQWSKQARILLFNLSDRIVCLSHNYCSITLGS